jgi:hypothetical protein
VALRTRYETGKRRQRKRLMLNFKALGRVAQEILMVRPPNRSTFPWKRYDK